MKKQHPSVNKMWEAFCSSPEKNGITHKKHYNAYHFCNTKSDADTLANLVKTGVKTATASSLVVYQYENEPLPEVGDYNVITDWEGVAHCIVRTTHVTVCPFNEVREEFAAKEGEGDKSLNYWRSVHKRIISEELNEIGETFTESTPVVCEEFEVVYPDHISLF